MSNRKAVTPAAAAAAASAAPLSAVPRRASRLPTAAVLSSLAAAGSAGVTVPALAAALNVPERDVRLAIDALRVKKFPILRSALKTFSYVPAA